MFTITTPRQVCPGDKNLFGRMAAVWFPNADVHEVTAERLVMSAERVDEALRTGALRSTDLVELDGARVALADALPFLDAAAVAARRERRVALAKKCLQALVLVGFAAGNVLIRLWLANHRAACAATEGLR